MLFEDVRKLYLLTKLDEEYKFPKKPSSDGYYHIWVKDDTKKSGRRAIKAKTLDELKEKVIFKKKGITFKEVFNLTQNNKLKYIKDKEKILSANNTINVNNSNYKRYFADTDFEKLAVKDITKKDIEEICLYNLRRYQMSSKAFLNMRGIIKAVLTFSFEEYYILDNIYERVNFKKFEAMLIKPVSVTVRIHSDEEIRRMINYIHNYQERKPLYIPAYALELQILMGLRRGEVPPIEWNDILDDSIRINKEQLVVKRDNGEGFYNIVVSHTKTYVDRYFPLTDDISEFIDRLSQITGNSKYLFPNDANPTGIISNAAPYKFYQRMCKNLGIELTRDVIKGPHSFRRIGITKVTNSPKGNIEMASILYGNSVYSATRNYYTGIDMNTAKDILNGNQ